MTHRTVDFGAGPVQVFDTGLALQRWAKRNAGDCIAVARGKFYFQRKAGFEITARLDPTDCEANRHVVTAANAVADEVERLLEKDRRMARGNFLHGRDAGQDAELESA